MTDLPAILYAAAFALGCMFGYGLHSIVTDRKVCPLVPPDPWPPAPDPPSPEDVLRKIREMDEKEERGRREMRERGEAWKAFFTSIEKASERQEPEEDL